MRRAGNALLLALAFLTILPVRFGSKTTDADLAASRFFYPFIGGFLGLMLAGTSWGLSQASLSPQVAAFVILALWVILSGGLHLDGLADTFDGLFLWGDAGRRLEVLRDPHVGSYGVTALVLVLLGKLAALETLAETDRSLALLGASIVARCLVLTSAGVSTYARPSGTGRILIDATRPIEAALATGLALAVGAALAGWVGLLASLGALGVAAGLTIVAQRRLGGITGDILGALVELSELAYLLVLCPTSSVI